MKPVSEERGTTTLTNRHIIMKRILTTFAAILVATVINAQQHLTFMDIPIDGPMEKMIESLSEKGLTYKGMFAGNIAQMSQDVNGQEIDILVTANEKTHNVYRISILTQPKGKWKILKREYEVYQKQLYEQYGEPTTYEMFMYPYNTKKKIRKHELEALQNEKAVWNSFFKVYGENEEKIGDIMLTISPYAYFARVAVYYEDALNAPQEEE
jgi:hypothetical protein